MRRTYGIRPEQPVLADEARDRSQGVKMDEFVACVNDHSCTRFFSAAPRD
jgi:hypothetical protein